MTQGKHLKPQQAMAMGILMNWQLQMNY
jgi:hypothetical protein